MAQENLARRVRACNWCCTLNNPSDIEKAGLKVICQNQNWFRYAIIGEEGMGAGKTPHLQCYFQMVKQQRMSWMKTNVSERAHFERARGSPEQNIDYCSKEDPLPWETGTVKLSRKQAGACKGAGVFKMIKEGAAFMEIAENYPAYCIMYMKSVQELCAAHKRAANELEAREVMVSSPLRPWQIEVMEEFVAQTSRKLLWLYDIVGGSGKSWLMKNIGLQENGIYIENAKKSDVARYWNYEPMVACNFTREKEGKISYSTLESLKDGAIFSGKYEPVSKLTNKLIKVIVAANWLPEFKMMSLDRWQICEIYRKDGVWTTAWWNDETIEAEAEKQLAELANER